MASAGIDAMTVTIDNMKNMENVFDISGAGSSATIDGLMITNTDLTQVQPAARWIGMNVRDGAMATVSNAEITNNTNARHVFSAMESATMTVNGATVAMTNGGRAVVSFFYWPKFVKFPRNLLKLTNILGSSIRTKLTSAQLSSPTFVQKQW
jgi:superfamily II helicase